MPDILEDTLEDAQKANAWPFIEAQKILHRIKNNIPEKGHVLFCTGYGPSGLPHIGTFGEVARTVMVRNAFSALSSIPTKLLCFSDDMDGLRSVPTNIPNANLLVSHLGKPLTSIPDPFELTESYGHYMNAKLRSFLDKFGFEYEFLSSTYCYKSGMFDHMMIKVLHKYQEIMDIMLPTLREERRATYSPFMPICKKTGKVLQVKIESIDKEQGLISYIDPIDQEQMTVSVKSGNCKLQWKPDFAMRWAALGVDYEMYGKDHMPNAQIYSEICQVLKGTPPVQFFYELFLNAEGAKISKSKGNSITVDEWLKYAPTESMALFMYHSPSKAKRLHFDVIPKNVDDYITFNQKYHAETDRSKQLANPVYHIHGGSVPKINTFGITFGLLLNLVSVCNTENKSVLWGFISKYSKECTPQTSPYLDHLTHFAINYYNDFIKQTKSYLTPNESQITVLRSIIKMLEEHDEESSPQEIQNKIYAIGVDSGYQDLRQYFKEIYQILLGQTEGPRLGSFISLYGIENSINLIKSRL